MTGPSDNVVDFLFFRIQPRWIDLPLSGRFAQRPAAIFAVPGAYTLERGAAILRGMRATICGYRCRFEVDTYLGHRLLSDGTLILMMILSPIPAFDSVHETSLLILEDAHGNKRLFSLPPLLEAAKAASKKAASNAGR